MAKEMFSGLLGVPNSDDLQAEKLHASSDALRSDDEERGGFRGMEGSTLIADRDSGRVRDGLTGAGIVPCIPGRSNRKVPIEHGKALYKRRNFVERMFGRLKDWRRVATRYDRSAEGFFGAICLAAIVLFWF